MTQQLELFQVLREKLVPGGQIYGCLPLPGVGSRLSDLLKDRLQPELVVQLKEAETHFYENRAPLPDQDTWERLEGLQLKEWSRLSLVESVTLGEAWLAPWIQERTGSWWQTISSQLATESAKAIVEQLTPEHLPPSWRWTRTWQIFRLQKTGHLA